MRYESLDEKQETRRERNAKFGKDSPDVDVPDAGQHIWEWFWKLSAQRDRSMGVSPLKMADVWAWNDLGRISINPNEFDILLDMDLAYREQQTLEEADQRERNKPTKPGKAGRTK